LARIGYWGRRRPGAEEEEEDYEEPKDPKGYSVLKDFRQKTISRGNKITRTMAKKSIKWIVRCMVILLLLYGIVQLVGAVTLGVIWTSNFTKKDLIDNYKARKGQILAVKDFFASVVPPHKHVEIEFSNNHTLFTSSIS
jgi:hypothetical protein